MSLNQAVPISNELALQVAGMTCESCARTVERVLASVPGVRSAAVNFARSLAVVSGTAQAAELVAAVEGAGFWCPGRSLGRQRRAR
jgi:copper chaperone CopZ